MTEPGPRVLGEDRLAATLGQVADDLDALRDADRAVATLVFAAATERVPVRTGALRASGTPAVVEGVATVSYSLPYANPIHWGVPERHIKAQPWLVSAARDREPEVLGAYEAAVQRLLNTVHGA